MKVRVSFEEARKTELANTNILGVEKLPSLECLNRIIAENIISDIIMPPWDNSAVDGYGIIGDYKEGDRKKIIKTIPAGEVDSIEISSDEVVKIMTGAPVTKGIDRVIMVEDTEVEDEFVILKKSLPKWRNIRKKGEDIKNGEVILQKGDLLRAQEIGVIASIGRNSIFVIRKPVVGFLATGNEIVDVDEHREIGQIRTSNSYTVLSQIKETGAEGINLGIAKDNKESLKEKLKDYNKFDVIVSSGGVSMGDYDLVKDVIEEIGFEILFWKVKERPGLPLVFAKKDNTLFFGLPGNPVSSTVMFEQHVRPVLLKMMGHKKIFRTQITAKISDDLSLKPGLRHFPRVIITEKNGELIAELTGNQGSGILTSLVKADGILVYPENTQYKKGDFVNVEILNDRFFYRSEQ